MAMAVPQDVSLDSSAIEHNGIQRVPANARRKDHTPRLIGTTWFTMNFVLTTVTLGALAIPAFGLGLVDAFAAILIGNAFGVYAVAFLCTLGPETGLRQMTIARYSFGWGGAQITAFLNVLACLGWSTVNVIIGGALLKSIWGWPFWLCIFLLSVSTTVVSIYGIKWVLKYEKYAWMPLAVVFAILAITSVKHWGYVPTPAVTLALVAGWFSYLGAIAGFAIGWSSYASDYSTYMPESTSQKELFRASFVGEFVALVLLESFGVMLTTWLPKAFGTEVLTGAVGPLGGIGKVFLFVLVLSVIANNVPNDYSLGLTVQVFGHWWEKIERWVLTLIGAVIYVAAALILGENITSTLEGFLLIIAYWLGPFCAVLILDYYFRGKKYPLDDWDDPKKVPNGLNPAIIAFFVGLFVALMSANQMKWQGPIGKWFGGDLGFELGTLATILVYWILAGPHKRTARTRR